jgi:hypothetical protein
MLQQIALINDIRSLNNRIPAVRRWEDIHGNCGSNTSSRPQATPCTSRSTSPFSMFPLISYSNGPNPGRKFV